MMALNLCCRNGASWFGCLISLLFAALILFITSSPRGVAQPPADAAGAEPKASLPQMPAKPIRPLPEVTSFVDSLSTNDARVDVVVGQARIVTLKEKMKVPAVIGVGDPSVLEFTILKPYQIRVLGQRMGMTDLTVLTADDRIYSLEVHVVADLDQLRLQLRATFPDASLKLAQMRDHVIVEGQARDTAQVKSILETIRAYMQSVYATSLKKIKARGGEAPGVSRLDGASRPAGAPPPKPGEAATAGEAPTPVTVSPEVSPAAEIEARVLEPRIINLIRVPGSQQVLLKVRVAELNRTALRQIGADFLAVDHDTGAIVGTQIGGANAAATAAISSRRLMGTASHTLSGQTTAFGIFEKGDFELMFSALRRNTLLKILAEPNLVALNGHQASVLAGGEFPVPVPQVGASGVAPTITILFKEFGVRLGFVPYILDDDTIRLTVDPEVSSIDFTIATTLVAGGSPVPGVNTRKAHTTVEMHQGQTLAIAGLLQLTLDGSTARIPGLGDLPILGPFFSNTTGNRIEKELIVLVTPYLVEPMNPDQVPPSPGDEVNGPNDLEFYLLNRIEGRTGRDFRATTEYDDALHVLRCFMKLEKERVRGPHGYCD